MDADVIVVGAGFAGLAAARELSTLGRSVIVLEARSRIGGRAWADDRLGATIEMGGAHLHWAQPHFWREAERYGLTADPRPAPGRVNVLADGAHREFALDDWRALISRLHEVAFEPAKSVFPNPYQPLREADLVAQADAQSAADHLRSVIEDPTEHAIIEAMWSIQVCADPARASLASQLRIAALSEANIGTYLSIMSGFSLSEGTRALAHAMVDDCSADVRLDSAAVGIGDTGTEVEVTPSSGETVQAGAVIVTVPISVMEAIAFTPELPSAKRDAIARGQASTGMKAWMRVTPDPGPWFAVAENPSPLQIIHRDFGRPDGTAVLHGFGSDHTRMDLNDVASAQAALGGVLPGVEVLEATGHDWIADPYARETWAHFPPGGLVSGFEALRAPHGRVHFAGAMLARGWMGFIDGAIETGIETGRRLHDVLDRQPRAVA